MMHLPTRARTSHQQQYRQKTLRRQLGAVIAAGALALLSSACGSTSFGSNAANTSRASAAASGAGSGAKGTDTGSGSGTAVSGTNNTAGTPTGGNGSSTTQAVPPPPPNIGFGLLVNDLNCTFCHLEVHGTVVSVATVPAFRSDSHGEVFGNWLINGVYNAPAGLSSPPTDGGMVISAGNATSSYNNAGGEMPIDPMTKAVIFPSINFTTLATTVQGSVASPVSPSKPLVVTKSYTGNVLMVGTQAQPIIINKDVLINGDLVIKGYYKGVGTIYATGNIYIPANLKASTLASFPYSDTPSVANTTAQSDLAAGTKDALGLASAKNIFVGDLENYMDSSNGDTHTTGADGERYNSIYEAGMSADPLMLNTNNGIRNVYSWLPEASFEALYEMGTPCWTSSNRTLVTGHNWGEREFTEVDAYLYASDAIAGVDRASNWTINGGMIAQAMHIVSGAGSDSVLANAVCGAARINFDYRMRNGLQVLEALSAYFPDVSSGSGTGAVTGSGSGT